MAHICVLEHTHPLTERLLELSGLSARARLGALPPMSRCRKGASTRALGTGMDQGCTSPLLLNLNPSHLLTFLLQCSSARVLVQSLFQGPCPTLWGNSESKACPLSGSRGYFSFPCTTGSASVYTDEQQQQHPELPAQPAPEAGKVDAPPGRGGGSSSFPQGSKQSSACWSYLLNQPHQQLEKEELEESEGERNL